MRNLAPKLLSVILLAALLAGAIALADPSEPAEAAVEGCEIPSDEPLAAAQNAPRDGHFPYQDWVANDAAQEGVSLVNAAVDWRFGDPGETDTLRAGLVGIGADNYAQELVVVVDEALVDEGALQKSITVATRATPLRVRVGPACRSVAELVAARTVLAQQTWHPRASSTPMAYFLDDYNSTFNVSFAAEDRDVADALKLVAGDAVTIEYGTPTLDGRQNDGEPHWGGAGIRQGGQDDNTCTSGFTAVMPNGNKGSVTVGHCYRNDHSIYSGNEFYGETAGRHDYPQFDMIRIQPQGETFARKIHVDPCCPVVRTVVAANNPDEEQFVCISGMRTRSVCGIEIRDRDATLCAFDRWGDYGCRRNLIRARKPGKTVAVGGDSGAPIYNRFGSDGAALRGMHVGHSGDPDDTHFYRVSTIRNHLNIGDIAQ